MQNTFSLDFAVDFIIVLALGASATVWALSRAKFAPKPIRPPSPQANEFLCALVSVVCSFAGFWLVYSGYLMVLAPSGDTQLLVESMVLLAFPAVLNMALFGGGLKSLRITARNWQFSLLLGIAASIVLLLPTITIGQFLVSRGPSFEFAHVSTIPADAFIEELFWRGFFQRKVEGFLGLKTGLFATALAFASSHVPGLVLVYHLSAMTALIQVILVVPGSLVVGYIAQRSDNLLGSVIYHSLYNLSLMLI